MCSATSRRSRRRDGSRNRRSARGRSRYRRMCSIRSMLAWVEWFAMTKKQEVSEMANKVYDVKTGDLFKFKPSELIIVGLDTEDGPEHPLYDDRIGLPV